MDLINLTDDPSVNTDGKQKVLITMYVMISLNSLLLLVSIFQFAVFLRKMKCSDKSMILTLTFIIIACLIKEVYLIEYSLEIENQIPNRFFMVQYVLQLYCNCFYIMAFILTFSKWANFTFLVETQISKPLSHKLFFKVLTIHNIISTCLCLLVLHLSICFTVILFDLRDK